MLYMRQHQEDGSYDSTRYFEYLRTIERLLPHDLRDMASLSRSRFGGAATMYDAAIAGYALSYSPAVAVRGNQRRLDLKLTLAGRWDDRLFHIHYRDVTLHTHGRGIEQLKRLYVHELAIADGAFRHEIDFRNGLFLVECSELSFEEEMLAQ